VIRTLVAEFTVPGPPVPWARPRIGKSGGRRHFMTSPKDAAHRQDIALCFAGGALKPTHVLTEPVELEVFFLLPIPPSTSKVRAEWMRTGRILPTGKPDVDNLVKSVKDALSGLCFSDDALVTDVVARKRYSVDPRTDVRVFTLAPA
jgi:Holliday junction resolvase RusA-like endonuclease